MSESPEHAQLKQALADAGSAHHDYEQVTLKGVRDDQWAGFYAAFALGRLGDFAKPSALTAWLEEVSSDDWAESAAKRVLEKLG